MTASSSLNAVLQSQGSVLKTLLTQPHVGVSGSERVVLERLQMAVISFRRHTLQWTVEWLQEEEEEEEEEVCGVLPPKLKDYPSPHQGLHPPTSGTTPPHIRDCTPPHQGLPLPTSVTAPPHINFSDSAAVTLTPLFCVFVNERGRPNETAAQPVVPVSLLPFVAPGSGRTGA
uniref:Uncharacterized protein n=1 Tax=Knipowitschia caucasica TaxID=637954 RepID=A0AAV2LIR4_KNICA